MTKMEVSLKKAIERLSSKRWPTRQRGIRELIELNKLELALEYALKETVPAVFDEVCHALYPEEPIELIIHNLTATKGPDAALSSRFYLPYGNYSYANDEIASIYKPRAAKLPVKTIEGIGLAGITGLESSFVKLSQKPITTKEDELSAASQRTIASVMCLARLDFPQSVDNIYRLISEIQDSLPLSRKHEILILQLFWVLYANGVIGFDELFEKDNDCLSIIGADVITTALKAKDRSSLSKIIDDIGEYACLLGGEEFYYWPANDYLLSEGVVDINMRSIVCRTWIYNYWRARKYKVDPPGWWSWRAKIDMESTTKWEAIPVSEYYASISE